ncbi:hypothetical protein DFH09DRAFT_1358785 [Mycena vulgaris]|nr:hypothetical protein DFH09DRAFT_1358785 [Mycena vulgaris]
MSASPVSESDSVPGPVDMDITPGSRRQRLLTTNEVPDPSDVTSIQSDMVKSAPRLAFLDHEIPRLVQLIMSKSGSYSTFNLALQILDPESSLHRDQMVKCGEERTLLLDYRAKTKAILSPLRRMPPEVLGEIFLLTLPSRIQEASLSSVIHCSPWVLTHVSSRWREVAISNPSLWSRVAIDYYKKPRYSIPMIETQIQRAHMLRIYFYGSTGFDAKHQLQMLRSLAERSAHWEELNIGVTKKMLPVLAKLRGRLPALRRVWIQWEENSARREPMDCFQSAPSLRDITIFNDSPSQVGILLPAPQLTRYDADGPWEMHRALLPSAQNLVEVRIETDSTFPASGKIIELVHLQRLFVSRIHILDYLQAPALEEFACNIGENYAYDDGRNLKLLPHLDPFVLRSACTLRRLGLRFLHNYARELAPILEKYPSIVSLAILTPKPGALISRLTIPKSFPLTTPKATAKEAISPQLSEISIGTPTPIKWVGYIAMLESRWKVKGCALRSSTAASDPNPTLAGAEIARLDALRKDGLDISLLKGDDAGDAMRAWMYIPKWV